MVAFRVMVLLAVFAAAGCKKKKESAAPTAAKDGGVTTTLPPVTADAQEVVAAAAAALPDAAVPDAAAAVDLDDDAKEDICIRVTNKIIDCAEDESFLAGLTEGLSAADKKRQIAFVEDEWPKGICRLWEYDWEYNGFRDDMAKVADPSIVETCAKLGTAVREAGGMWGGEMIK